MNITNSLKLLDYWQSGSFKIDFSENNLFTIEGTKERIVIDILDKELLKNFISLDALKAKDDMPLEEIAEKLDEKGITLILSIEGKEWLVLGKNAKPKILRLFTGQDDIQIKHIGDIIKSIIQLKL